jgi:hypothetical protein
VGYLVDRLIAMTAAPPRLLLTLADASPEVPQLAAAAQARRALRGALVTDINGDAYRIVDAVPSVIVSGAREATGLFEVEFEGRVVRE